MAINELLKEAEQHNVRVVEHRFNTKRLRGLYVDGVITINSAVTSSVEKTCILAEELGHHHTSVGNILDQNKLQNRKQELRARQWAYKRLIPLSKFVQAYKAGVRGRHEIAEYLHVTESFLEDAIRRYRQIYGIYAKHNQYYIYFDPLGVVESFD